MSDTTKKLYRLIQNMRRAELLDHAKRVFPHGTPEESYIYELMEEAERRARYNKQNRVWNTHRDNILRAAKQTYPLWREWSNDDYARNM